MKMLSIAFKDLYWLYWQKLYFLTRANAQNEATAHPLLHHQKK